MNLKTEIINYLSGSSEKTFEEIAMLIYYDQSKENAVYKEFLNILGRLHTHPSSLDDIPLLPITAFKTNIVKSGKWNEETIFLSSGTGDSNRSKHYVENLSFYKQHSLNSFNTFYQESNYKILGLLPSYLENGHSSLVHMVDGMMDYYNSNVKAHFLYDFDALVDALEAQKLSGESTILIGVTFALIDFANYYQSDISNLNIVFTGGMKNRGLELSYEDVFDNLKSAFPNSQVDAEYGMTEMFSQSYCQNNRNGIYKPSLTLSIMSKELNDPLSSAQNGKTGQLGFIDLANYQTCSFVLTDDLCVKDSDGNFKVLGRKAQSDLRGCNMLYQI